MEIVIKNAPDMRKAIKVGRSIASSALFKTCIYGGDPNWGRIAASLGASTAKIKSNKFDISLGNKQVVRNGAALGVPEEAIRDAFKKKEIKITVDLKLGKESASVYTCDLTEKYIKLNADYTT